jgi:hypothetical protein
LHRHGSGFFKTSLPVCHMHSHCSSHFSATTKSKA